LPAIRIAGNRSQLGNAVKQLKEILSATKQQPRKSGDVITPNSDGLVELYRFVVGFLQVLLVYPPGFVDEQMSTIEFTLQEFLVVLG
jgi:hypothetical protein